MYFSLYIIHLRKCLKGQSIYTILNNHPEIKFCEKTIYNYVEIRLFKDQSVTIMTLKRKVKRIAHKKQSNKREESNNYNGRIYFVEL